VFFDVIAPRISMLVVGPPIERGRQWLALMRAGLLKVDLGPSPEVHRDYARRTWRAQSTRFDRPYCACLDQIVRGQVRQEGLKRSGLSLPSMLYRAGLCSAAASPAQGGDEALVPRLDHMGHPLDATGLAVRSLTLLGVPTEGATYFNHYLPSPKSRSHAFEQIQRALDALLENPAVAAPSAAAEGLVGPLRLSSGG
jgi:hypothetical protein